MIWEVISWYSAGPPIHITGWITAIEYLNIFNDEVLTLTSIFPIQTVKKVQSWFEERQNVIKHLPWPAQSPDLNILNRYLEF